MSYTEQEIAALVSWYRDWTEGYLSEAETRDVVIASLAGEGMHSIISAARLMRDARRQGAQEMREKAATMADEYEISPREVIGLIRALPLPGDADGIP